jgi:hypothetical protein
MSITIETPLITIRIFTDDNTRIDSWKIRKAELFF